MSSRTAKDDRAKAGSSELTYVLDELRYWQKSYPRGNGTIVRTSSYQAYCLLLRCWFNTTWIGSTIQGSRGSLVKVFRELSSNRRETGWFLST